MLGQLSNPWWLYVILGIFAGIVSAALGLGSGIIIVPTLVLLCAFGQKTAQGMALAVMVPMALVGALRYWKNPEIPMNVAVIGLIICGALIGALIGSELAARLPGHILRRMFAVVLVIAAVRMFIARSPSKPSALTNSLTNSKNVNLVEHGDAHDQTKNQ